MKNIGKIAGILMVILVAGSLDLDGQRVMRGYRQDSTFIKHDSLRMYMNGRPGPRYFDHTMAMGRMAPGAGRMNPWMNHGMMRQKFGRQYGFRGGMMPGGPGRRIMESIPGITEKQKEDLSKLNEKQKAEMQNLMEKNREEIRQLREEHRKNVLNILTDEQKKWLEEHSQETGINKDKVN